MNHNPYNFKQGDTVILDGKYEVRIVRMTSSYLFSDITDGKSNEYWTVMTNRLTPVKK